MPSVHLLGMKLSKLIEVLISTCNSLVSCCLTRDGYAARLCDNPQRIRPTREQRAALPFLDAKGLIDCLVIPKLLTVVHGQRLDSEPKGLIFSSMARPTKSAVLLLTLTKTAKPFLRSTSVTMACLCAAPMTV